MCSLEFAEDFRKTGLFCRVDVGIDPYENNERLMKSGKRIKLFLPDAHAGVTRHAPVASGRERDRADLRPIGQAAALELLLEEAAVEVLQPVQKHLVRVAPLHRGPRQTENFRGREAIAKNIIEIEAVQLIRADEGFRLLRDLAVFGGRKQLRADGRVENVEKDAPQRGGSGASAAGNRR